MYLIYKIVINHCCIDSYCKVTQQGQKLLCLIIVFDAKSLIKIQFKTKTLIFLQLTLQLFNNSTLIYELI